MIARQLVNIFNLMIAARSSLECIDDLWKPAKHRAVAIHQSSGTTNRAGFIERGTHDFRGNLVTQPDLPCDHTLAFMAGAIVRRPRPLPQPRLALPPARGPLSR